MFINHLPIGKLICAASCECVEHSNLGQKGEIYCLPLCTFIQCSIFPWGKSNRFTRQFFYHPKTHVYNVNLDIHPCSWNVAFSFFRRHTWYCWYIDVYRNPCGFLMLVIYLAVYMPNSDCLYILLINLCCNVTIAFLCRTRHCSKHEVFHSGIMLHPAVCHRHQMPSLSSSLV